MENSLSLLGLYFPTSAWEENSVVSRECPEFEVGPSPGVPFPVECAMEPAGLAISALAVADLCIT